MNAIVSLLVTFLISPVFATPSMTNISEEDFKNISKEMSANFTHNSMMGASKLGTILGFQVGLVAAQTASPKLDEISKRSGGSEFPNLYNAGLLGVLGIPFGVSFEAAIVPKIESSGANLSSTSLALKWNINDVIPVLPVNLALRGVYSTSKFSFSQTVLAMPSTVDNKTTVTGIQLLFSPMFPVIEPYIGVGLLNGSNELSVTGTPGTIFDPTFSISQSEKKSVSSTQFILGVEASLLVLKLGAEYSQSFGTSRYGIKLAFGF